MYVVDRRQTIVGSDKPVVCAEKNLSLQPDRLISCLPERAGRSAQGIALAQKIPEGKVKASAGLRRHANPKKGTYRREARRENLPPLRSRAPGAGHQAREVCPAGCLARYRRAALNGATVATQPDLLCNRGPFGPCACTPANRHLAYLPH